MIYLCEIMIPCVSEKKISQRSTHDPIEEGNQSVVLQPEHPFLLPFHLNIPYISSVTQNLGLPPYSRCVGAGGSPSSSLVIKTLLLLHRIPAPWWSLGDFVTWAQHLHHRRERGNTEWVPGINGEPTTNIDEINLSFPLSRPDWDYNTARGKERLWVYRQTLLGVLKAAASKPTNLARVRNVQQGPTKSPAAFLERLMEAFRQYTPMDPEEEGTQAALMMHFVNQVAPDIRKKLQKLERLGEKSIQDLIIVAERVYNTHETPEEKQAEVADRQTRNTARILSAATVPDSEKRERQLRRLATEGKSCPRT